MIVIKSDKIQSWDKWEQFLTKTPHLTLDSSGPILIRPAGHLLGVIEDRFGWDFIYEIQEGPYLRGGLVIEDRNGGMPIFYRTANPSALLDEAIKKLPQEYVGQEEYSVWSDRWERFKEIEYEME